MSSTAIAGGSGRWEHTRRARILENRLTRRTPGYIRATWGVSLLSLLCLELVPQKQRRMLLHPHPHPPHRRSVLSRRFTPFMLI
ncbi:uncharacterized protein EURHEDRAFT_292650 [Aspergillus ruber CBS 135680]|uniref:Uncharacterized protein n=1 Tax=Aspergillus ruber (strain CBS 135680) TaxID=1388766 RepID=A0A017S0V3_ASPRC|nr:uncharacterized protein EURHEDRAFT_292650 [Aspergillus ruber CBS 135680]EYE90471.1 hypothetical protein EURHEDRAFT_292650 [Aspergillus ruber CBS 135680]